MLRFTNLFLIVIMSLILTACGGGGGSSSAVVNGSTYTMTGMTLSPTKIDGANATTSISVQIRQNSNGIISAYSGATVRFTSTCITQGKATLSNALAANGTYTATYTNNGCSGNDIIVANASVDGANLNPIEQSLAITGVVQTIGELTITAANTNVPADGVTQTAIRVFVSSTATSSSGTTSTTGTPATGVVVNFATTKGSLSANSAITDSQGYASVYLISDEEAGQATVTASANGFLRSTSVGMGSLTPPARLIVSSGDVVKPNSLVTISTIALDSYGQPVANANLIFEAGATNRSGGRLLSYSATTNAQGMATVYYQAGSKTSDYGDVKDTVPITVAGYDTITVNTANGISKDINIRVTDSITNDNNPANMILITGNGTTDVPADSTTAVLVSAAISNLAETPLAGKTVTFSTTLGSISATAITDSNGVARAFLKSGTAGTATITASVEGIVRATTVNFVPSNTNTGGSSANSSVKIGTYTGTTYTAGTIQAPASVNANGTATLTFNLFNSNNTPYTTDSSTNITLSSNCVLMGKASIAAPTYLGNGVYTAIYTDMGCASTTTNTVTATATINYATSTASVLLPIASATSSGTIQLGYYDGTTFIPGVIYGGGSSTNIAANSSTTLRLNAWDVSLPYTTDISSSLSFSSNCQLTGKAKIDTITNLGNGVYTAVYTDLGCSLSNAQNTITATATVNGQNTNSATTTIGTTALNTANVQMGSCTDNNNCAAGSFTTTLKPTAASVSAGQQTTIEGVLWDSATSTYYTSLTQITLTSACALAGKAIISDTSATNGKFSATYQDKGCATTDTITATAIVNGTTLTASTSLTVAADTTGSIQFISATPTMIAIKGSGTPTVPEQSAIKFKVFGNNTAIPVSGKTVTFALSTTTGGIGLNPISATSDSNGEVTTIVSAGTIPTPVRVLATVDGKSTQSSELSISTTLPDQPHFSMAAETPNPTGAWDIQGTSTSITLLLADQFSNPPPAGTVVNFRAESGQITSTCSTSANGSCTVTWVSQTANNNPPLNYYTTTEQDCKDIPTGLSSLSNKDQGCVNKAGRVTIMAWVLGSEGFIDNNNNGTFDNGDAFATSPANYANPPTTLSDYFNYDRRDLEPPYLDANFNFVKETGTTAGVPNEYEVPNAQMTASEYTNAYNGVLCNRTSAPLCSTQKKSIYIFRNLEIVMPTRNSNITFWDNAGTSVIGSITAAGTYKTLIQDSNGNTMGDGTSIAIAASADADNLTVTATPPTVDKQAGYGEVVGFSVSRSDSTKVATGKVEVTITSGGIITTKTIDVSI